MSTDPSPRRKWHFNRWLIVLIVATMGWGGWQAYAFHSALAQAKALRWLVQYTDPVVEIRKNWKAGFMKETWLDGVTYVGIPTSKSFEQHLATVHRLNPKELRIGNAPTLRDLSALKPLNRLQTVSFTNCTGLTNMDALKSLSALQKVLLTDCTGLTNVDALENLSALQLVSLTGSTGLTNIDGLKDLAALKYVFLKGCTGLTNVEALKNLSALRTVWLNGCTGLSTVSVAALKTALPNTQIAGP